MRILVIGSGGREHALAWKLDQAGHKVFVAPGNGGTEDGNAVNVPLAVDDLDGILKFCKRESIDLAVPGPELPLTLGIVDRLQEAGIPCFGPDAYCSRLEGSKSFAKEVMAACGVPTAKSAVFTDVASCSEYIRKINFPPVIKADGLASGKGVVVAESHEEAFAVIESMLEDRAFGAAGERILIEERLEGEEVSLLCLCDGKRAVPLPSAQDHKAAWDHDRGPNTGGMGAYSPAPVLPDEELEQLADLTVRPVLREMARRGHPFRGVLYAGLMMTASGPKVLEYNVRFGDPECQPLLMRLEGDLASIMLDCIHGRLDPKAISWSDKTALGVVLAARGYPGDYAKGKPIKGIEEANALAGVKVFHSGTRKKGSSLVSSGGRVLCVAALGDSLEETRAKAYAALEKIKMPESFFRSDIGEKGLHRLAGEEWATAMEADKASEGAKVVIIMGSQSDEPSVAPCAEILRELGVSFILTVSSAHRTPERTCALVAQEEAKGAQVFICAAGMAAHLAGAVAARTIKPVIGIPVSGTALGGMDALLSTVQMPPGFPVATLALDKAGARNAAWLAAQILALEDKALAERIARARKKMAESVAEAGNALTRKYA